MSLDRDCHLMNGLKEPQPIWMISANCTSKLELEWEVLKFRRSRTGFTHRFIGAWEEKPLNDRRERTVNILALLYLAAY